MSLYRKSKTLWRELTSRLNSAGDVIPALFLRLILFWEFWESGTTKYAAYQQGGDSLQGTIGWFATLNFPFPFNHLSAEVNFYAAMWGEMFFALLILFGLFTRFAAVSLIVITAVAAAAAHWPEAWTSLPELWKGYAISDRGFGNYKLALLFIIMLTPLLFNGAGKFSLDHILSKFFGCTGKTHKMTDLATWGLAFAVIGLIFVFVMPYLGIGLIVLAIVSLIANKFLTPN